MPNENLNLKKKAVPISAAEHPKAWNPGNDSGLPLAVVGCIIGLELSVRTGVTPHTSIIEHCLPFVLSIIPVAFLSKYRQYPQTESAADIPFPHYISAANCMIRPIGIPLSWKSELMISPC